jgi:hypothetical protein
MCVRISKVPKDWSAADLLDALQVTDPSLKDTNHNISLYPACNGDTQTALLSLDTRGKTFKGLEPNKVTHVLVNAASGSAIDLEIDYRFYGLTPLNVPEGEIVAE